ncbi:dienelactone hydrolase family protein [Polyangium jinanense]|uniref:Dienelactone hydrolase family protein n=1 Tax=Polyangium jinanense TaxID=2829994 RepID=A0A9X3XH78_9BACT|nr:dienelactone hydrolase family protein [Polyangium jinanense]MDC3961530.1 dienelactone hydrolase family protein [Polyangium jinanense]MDC3989023.1 dienelactone hydrolase family protein [Polyangium jinanense]
MPTRIELQTEDGAAPAFVFGAENAPRVLFLIDGIGMRPAMHALAERLSSEGFYVLMPDLFHRLGAYTAPDPRVLFSDPEVRAAWFARLKGTTADTLLRDIGAYLEHLGSGQVGVTGYCMGGRLALSAAASYPDRVTAAAAYHPGGLVTDAADSPHLAYDRIKAEVYIGAATDDPSFTDAQRTTVADVLARAHVRHTIEVYPARHGWVPADTPVHDEACAARHWETLVALFRRALSK